MSTNAYESPFSSRYASEEAVVFSSDNKFKTWRKLWLHWQKQKALGIQYHR